MAAEPHEGAPPPQVHETGPDAPRAFRTSRDAPMAVEAPDLDVARHLALAREALPPDPRDALPAVPRLPLPRAEDLGEGERLDARSAGSPAPRRFRTRAPVALVPRRPLPASGEALLDGLAALQAELDAGRTRLARLEDALGAIDARLAAAAGAPAPAFVPSAAATSSASPPSASGRTATHSVAIEMAVSGFSRGEVGELIARQTPAVPVEDVLDEVFGPGSGPDARI